MKSKKIFYFIKETYGEANTFIKSFVKVRNRKIKTYTFCFEKILVILTNK